MLDSLKSLLNIHDRSSTKDWGRIVSPLRDVPKRGKEAASLLHKAPAWQGKEPC
jgi:hypothetical protein